MLVTPHFLRRPFPQVFSAVCFGAAGVMRFCWSLASDDAARELGNSAPAFLSVAFCIPLLAAVHSLYRGNKSALWLLFLFCAGPIISPPKGALKAGAQMPMYLLTYSALFFAGFFFALKPLSPRTVSKDDQAILYHSRSTNFFFTLFIAYIIVCVAGEIISEHASHPGTWRERLAANPSVLVLWVLLLWATLQSTKALVRPRRIEVTVSRNGFSYFDSLSIHGLSVQEWIPIDQVKSVRYSKKLVTVVIADRGSIKIPRNALAGSGFGSALASANRRIKVIDELDF